MASTSLEIANLALLRIGEKKFIDDAADGSTAADVFARAYEMNRDTLLARVPWNFAKRETDTLAALDGVERSGWLYCFALPADCLAVRSIAPATRQVAREGMVPFEIQANDDNTGIILCCDLEEPVAIYTAKVEAVPAFSPSFCDALVWALARDFCLAIPGKMQMLNVMEGRYEMAVRAARAAALREEMPDVPLDGSAVRARR